jgi:hypothetical protein
MPMSKIHRYFQFSSLDGLEAILARLAQGEISEAEAARQIQAFAASRPSAHNVNPDCHASSWMFIF